MIILGVDPSTRCSGFAVLHKEKQRTQLIDYGCLKFPASKKMIDRVGEFHTFFSEKINTWNVTDLAIEIPYLGKSPTTFGKLSYLRGILNLLAYTHKLELHEFTPVEVKTGVTGYGGASKEQVATMVLKYFPGIKVENDDTTDALAVSLCALWKNKKLTPAHD